MLAILPFVNGYHIGLRVGFINDAYSLKKSGIDYSKMKIIELGFTNDAAGIKELTGNQTAILNKARKIKGGQEGFASIAEEVEGFQASVLTNGADDAEGLQICGGANYAERIDGIQIAPVCYAEGGNYRQFGLVTIRREKGKGCRITPFYGCHKEK